MGMEADYNWDVRMNMEEYITGTGQKVSVHDRETCKWEHCCIHNPSDHHMKDWPTNWRRSRRMMERMCPHGVGHPDPDDIAHSKNSGVHGCDGCCKEIK